MPTIFEPSGSAPIRLEMDALYQVRDIEVAVPVYGAYSDPPHASAIIPAGLAADIEGGNMPGPAGSAPVITAGDRASVGLGGR